MESFAILLQFEALQVNLMFFQEIDVRGFEVLAGNPDQANLGKVAGDGRSIDGRAAKCALSFSLGVCRVS